MADIRPFMSIRPNKGKAANIAALPYDVYNRKEATEEVERHPESFLKIDRAETGYPLSVDMYDDKVYQRAHDLLWGMVEDGTFIKDTKNCYYIYELTMNGRTQTGITACASIDDYVNEVIKKHENTREEKEIDRIKHVDCCDAQTGPIFLAYRSNQTINEVVAKVKEGEPEYDFTSEDGIRHRVFVISDDAMIETVQKSFAGIGEIYIADGHHRAASAVKVGLKRRSENPGYDGTEEFNYFLSVLFPDDQLMIMDYNRVVKDLNGNSFQGFLKEVKRRFDVTEITEQEEKRPQEKGSFTMYMENHWFLCKIREEDKTKVADDPVKSLDVSLLQDLLLHPVLGIENPKTDSRIDFVGGIRGMEELVRRCEADCAVAFAMYPTSISELFDVADAGLLMPPKSTWFEPKLRSGLFIHALS
ncbi:MAG: DUF1015 domain-containing protein [Clostridiales bacterium]|nr:DUF1015 domain-containing protein [Clostridiales bacterium]